MFSAKHSFVDLKECTLIKNKNFTKIGGGLPECKRVFFGMFFCCFLVVLFLVACVLVLVFCKKAQKGYFPAILEVFCLFCSHKRPALKCFISSYFVFFCFCLSFQQSIFIFFLCINNFLENINVFGFFLFLFLAFSFLNVCLFLSNKLS